MQFSVQSPAKINLHLKVFEKNADGYHRVETTMVKIGLFDEIHFEITDGNTLDVVVTSPFEFLSGKDNLAFKAADLLLKSTALQKLVKIRITKNIPLGAGLGGGSSNAGVVLYSLNKHLGEPLSEKQLMELGRKLGADVPFFIQNHDFGFMKGRGDELVESCNFPALPMLVVYPNINASTAKVYQNLGRSLTWKGPNGISGSCNRHVSTWKDIDFLLEAGNDLQDVTIEMHPVIDQIRVQLKEHGAYFSQMSGSGASVFGLFNDEAAAKNAAQHFEKDFQCFYVKSGTSK